MDLLTTEQIGRLRSVPHFRESREAREDVGVLYLSYCLCFADLIKTYHFKQEPRVVADVGTGYGWLAIALAQRTSAHVIAVDSDTARMQAARQIATILGVEQRIEWRVGALPNLPMAAQEADVTFCVEVIEHVGDDPAIVADLGRVTQDLLVITTPNLLFPCIRHDTQLPFCHWLPMALRDRYAALFGRLHLQHGNRFWSPGMLRASLPEFRRISGLLQFPGRQHFLESECQLERAFGPAAPPLRRLRRRLFAAAALLGPYGVYVLPNIASAFRRNATSVSPWTHAAPTPAEPYAG